MSRLSVKLDYDKKAEELRKLVSVEAIKLQETIDKKTCILSEINALSSRKTALGGVLADLETKIKDKKEELNQLMVRENDFLSSIKTECEKESISLEKVNKELEKLNAEVGELRRIEIELKDFTSKEKEILESYNKQKERTENLNKVYSELSRNIKFESDLIELKRKDLEEMKKYVSDLYGKLASYVNTANNTIKYINEVIKETGAPIQFELPPGEIIKIDFNNFDKKPSDT